MYLPHIIHNYEFFYPREKTVDVGFFFHPTPERRRLNQYLTEFCGERGYSYSSGKRFGSAYAEAIGSAKININLSRNPQTRADRVFDVFLSGSCLLSDPLPHVSDEPRELNKHYLQFRNRDELCLLIDELLQEETWQVFAKAAYNLGQQQHTWAQRAQQLRRVLWEFGLKESTTWEDD